MDPAVVLRLSAIESEHFGIPIARARPDPGTGVEALLADARSIGARLLIVRVAVGAVDQVHALEAGGGRLCDTLVEYAATPRLGLDMPPGVRPGVSADAPRIEAIAAAAFAGYLGHYHADPRLDRAAADAAYADWARRSAVRAGDAVDVLVVERDGTPAGFLVSEGRAAGVREIVLNAVDPVHQRAGLYADLVRGALASCTALGATRCTVSTQLPNLAVQRVWVRLGFEPTAAFHTFHVWL